MRTAREILDDMNIVYSTDTYEYHDGLFDRQYWSYIVDNYAGNQLRIVERFDDNDIIRYDVDFFDTNEYIYLDGYSIESENELEALINGFTG